MQNANRPCLSLGQLCTFLYVCGRDEYRCMKWVELERTHSSTETSPHNPGTLDLDLCCSVWASFVPHSHLYEIYFLKMYYLFSRFKTSIAGRPPRKRLDAAIGYPQG